MSALRASALSLDERVATVADWTIFGVAAMLLLGIYSVMFWESRRRRALLKSESVTRTRWSSRARRRRLRALYRGLGQSRLPTHQYMRIGPQRPDSMPPRGPCTATCADVGTEYGRDWVFLEVTHYPRPGRPISRHIHIFHEVSREEAEQLLSMLQSLLYLEALKSLSEGEDVLDNEYFMSLADLMGGIGAGAPVAGDKLLRMIREK